MLTCSHLDTVCSRLGSQVQFSTCAAAPEGRVAAIKYQTSWRASEPRSILIFSNYQLV